MKANQKFRGKFKNVPRGAPQAPCSTSTTLNRVQRLSERGIIRTLNNSDVDRSGTRRSLKPLVYVLSIEGTPLMPCSSAKANRMLKKGAANVVKRMPFVIQLIFKCENHTQPITLGVDPGYEFIGLSAITEKKELFSAEFEIRHNIKELLTHRRLHRRRRRSKLWYREPRFNNRATSRKKGGLYPSIWHRLDSHIRIVDKIQTFLLLTKINVEVSNFDIQKIINPDIEGTDYQQGSLYGYENIKSYLIVREHGKCQLCGKEYIKSNPWRLHHITPCSRGGTNKPDNQTLLHKKCHEKLHKQNLLNLLKPNKQFKAETFMSTVRWKLIDLLIQKYEGVQPTFGYLTKLKRIELNLDKSHSNDAFVIADGKRQKRTSSFVVMQKRKNNRCFQLNRRGFAPLIRRKRYKIQPYDIITINNYKYVSKGIHGRGEYVVCVDKLGNRFDFNTKLINNVFNVGGIVWGEK